ncbi:MAG TPA: molybdate ABC transporter substrate-binding protein [Steroidobacteraceae bacterium]|nr:molybdate ABC transporter substrate-binding protein [Steroidobacteraceae bacterium]
MIESAQWLWCTRRTALARRARTTATLGATLLATLTATLLSGTPAARAAELHVAVAANFLGTLQKLAGPYQAASGNTLSISAGSSGQLLAQIRQGAPFDLFFSADAERPRQLESQGLGLPGSEFTYALGSLVLWSPRPGVIDRRAGVLRAGRFQRLALAAPGSAPYGAAAQQVLRALGLWDRFNQEHKIVIGESITQAWQFAASGNATLAFVALSQVIDAQGHISGSSWLPPQSLYAPLTQDALILKRTRETAAAENFEQWLKRAPQATRILLAAGYRTAP